MKERVYLCIDMKSFYASVECADRGLDPMTANLTVADESRGANTICLAVSVHLKTLGVKNRCRLQEIPSAIPHIVAPPRMGRYIECAGDIYSIYLQYFSPDSIHVYSIDEAFLDVTDYLTLYRTDGITMAKKLMKEIWDKLRIPATAGVGSNLYLAKIALDITAKHSPEHIGVLNIETYQKTLWDHRPITDFWSVSTGTAERLRQCGCLTMRDVTKLPVKTILHKFGKNGEMLYDHAFGVEPCLISDIKNYKAKSKSVSASQILPRDYTFEEAKSIVKEMVMNGARELNLRGVETKRILLLVGYSHDFTYTQEDGSRGGVTLNHYTALSSEMLPAVLELYCDITDRNEKIRRIGLAFEQVVKSAYDEFDLFTDVEAREKQEKLEKIILQINGEYGKNTVLRGVSYTPEGTLRERNGMIGGHKAGKVGKDLLTEVEQERECPEEEENCEALPPMEAEGFRRMQRRERAHAFAPFDAMKGLYRELKLREEVRVKSE